MGYDVVMRRNSDGLERTWHEEGEWDEVTEYMWSDGNCGCDCNRGDFFAQSGGEEDPNEDCGDTAYTVVRIVTPDGATVYADDP